MIACSGGRAPATSITWQAYRWPPASAGCSRAAISAAGSSSLYPSGTNLGCQDTACLLCGRSFQRGLELNET